LNHVGFEFAIDNVGYSGIRQASLETR